VRKNGRTLLENLKLINRGRKEFGKFLPGQLRLLFINSAVTMPIPYIGIYMTSVVISELSSQKRTWVLVASVAAAITLTLILTTSSALIVPVRAWAASIGTVNQYSRLCSLQRSVLCCWHFMLALKVRLSAFPTRCSDLQILSGDI